jgi:hypothetical protein
MPRAVCFDLFGRDDRAGDEGSYEVSRSGWRCVSGWPGARPAGACQGWGPGVGAERGAVGAALIEKRLNSATQGWRAADGAGELAQVTRCLEGRFTQRVNLRLPRSEAVHGARR